MFTIVREWGIGPQVHCVHVYLEHILASKNDLKVAPL